MTFRAQAIRGSACAALVFILCGFLPEQQAGKNNVDFLVTAAAVYRPLAALRGQERFPKGAVLLLMHEGKPSPLAQDFAATTDANVSFDGARVLFAGKKASSDPWQVWEMKLADRSVRQLTFLQADAIRPLYLPGESFVYALRTPVGFQLQSAAIDNADAAAASGAPTERARLPLTYANANAIPSDVLADGRILFESGFPLGSGATPELFLVYSDGSGVESYRCDHGAARWAGKQLASGDVVFTHGNALARFTSPLAHEERIAAPLAQYAGAVSELPSGDWLVSARRGLEKNYAIKLWKPGASTMEAVLSEPGKDLVEPVLVAPRVAPKRHPSALHPWDYSNLLALDARLSREGALHGVPTSVRLETQDATGQSIVLGTAPVESDGSYFVKVPGDRPLRFAVLDAKGTVLRQEHGWFWARGGEQRICVGCHTGPERAAENRTPAVLLRTTIPVDLTARPTAPQHAAEGGR